MIAPAYSNVELHAMQAANPGQDMSEEGTDGAACPNTQLAAAMHV